MKLKELISALERQHGRPKGPPTQDPFELILWENAAYIVDDARRLETYRRLEARVGLAPRDLLAAKRSALVEAIRPGGMLPPMRAEKLVRAAQLAEDFGAPLAQVVKRPADEARRILKRFPGIGEPGADKVLLLSEAQPVLALDSNGLRVLVRLGYGKEHRQYAQTYREAQARASAELPKKVPLLRRAHLILRHHGQLICKRSVPDCGACAIARHCPVSKRT
jgi:endonuclease III